MKAGISPILFLIVAIFVCSTGIAQPRLALAVRGKYLPLGGLEDFYGLTYTYGGEIILNDHHSIGIDGNMFRTRAETARSPPSSAYEGTRRLC